MANIGDLVVHLDANTQGLESGLDRATKATGRYRDAAGRMREANGKFVSSANAAGGAIEQTGRQAATASSAFGTLRARLTQVSGLLASIGIGIGLGAAVRQVADFQVAMNGLAATSNATAQEMESLEAQARELGATSRFSAQQAAEGQRFLAQAGFEVNEVLGATPGILQLATAAQLDLGSAADIASNVLGGMRLEVSELNRVNDVLAATASRSNTTIQQLGQALSFAAPFAAGAGIEIEEAAAAIGVMSDAGIQASRAGTGLVGTIRQLSKVTGDGEKILDKYGLSVEDVNIEARGLGPVLETLRQANLNTADAIALFGSEAGAAAQVLVNDYTGGIENATGESERMAGQMESGLTPAFRSLGSAISESVIQMGDSGLAGGLEGLIRSGTGVISVWNGMGEEWAAANGVGEDHLDTINAIASSIEGLVAAMIGGGGAVAALALLGGGIDAVKVKMIALNAVMRANPFIFIATTLGAAIGVIYQFREELGLVPSAAQSASDRIDEFTGSLDTNSRAALENAKAVLAAEQQLNNFRQATLAFQVAQQQQRVFDEQEQFDAVGGQAAFGMGAQTEAQKRLSELRNQLADARGGSSSASSALQEIDKLMDGLGKAGDGLIDTANKLVPTNDQAKKLGDNLSSANQAMSGATSAVDTFAGAATTAANRIANIDWGKGAAGTVSGMVPDEMIAGTPRKTGMLSTRQRLERQRDLSAYALEPNPNATATWSTDRYNAISQKYDAFGASSGRSANEAMQSADSRSGKNLGTLKLASEKGGAIDVQANSDQLQSWLANTLSGNAAAS